MYTIILITTWIYGITAQPISQYEPSEIASHTSEIIDSVFSLMDSTRIFIAGSKFEDCEYLRYWNKHSANIPEKDFFNLINHNSPVIRYHCYQYILENELASSSMEFINSHLDDLEYVQLVEHNRMLDELVWTLGDNGWIKTGPGFMPLILNVIRTAKLTKAESDLLYRSIIKENLNSKVVTEFPLSQLSLNESNYSLIKSLAHQGNITAKAMLAEYQRDENQELLSNHLDFVFRYKTDRENKRFIKHSVKYDYPKGSIDRFIEFYKDLKENDESRYKQYKVVYLNYAKNNTPIRKKLMNDLLFESNVSTEVRRNEIFQRIDSLLKLVPDHESIDFRIEYWKKSAKLRCSSFSDIKKHNPDMAFEIARVELDRLQDDNSRQYNCFRQFINQLVDRKLSPEKHINWALQSKDRYLPLIALRLSSKHPFRSSKTHIFNLMASNNSPLLVGSIIDALVKHELNQDEKDQIEGWVKPYHVMEKSGKTRIAIEEKLRKMGINKL